MSLTENQCRVLETLRTRGRERAFHFSATCSHLFQQDCARLIRGDDHCVYRLGTLTSSVAYRLCLTPAAVLRVLKSLERKGLVIRDQYEQRVADYWWPVGLADQICHELSEHGLNNGSL